MPAASRTMVEGFGHDVGGHVQRHCLLTGMATEVLLVPQVELVHAGELTDCDVARKRLKSPLLRGAKSVNGVASVLKTPCESESTNTESRSNPARYTAGRFSI